MEKKEEIWVLEYNPYKKQYHIDTLDMVIENDSELIDDYLKNGVEIPMWLPIAYGSEEYIYETKDLYVFPRQGYFKDDKTIMPIPEELKGKEGYDNPNKIPDPVAIFLKQDFIPDMIDEYFEDVETAKWVWKKILIMNRNLNVDEDMFCINLLQFWAMVELMDKGKLKFKQ
jgi:hypothetical protein